MKYLVAVAIIIAAVALYMSNPFAFQVIAGIIVGLALIISVLGLIAPLYIPLGWFTNKPGDDAPSGVHFFTLIEPGEVKIVVRGDKLVRMVMDTAGKRFARTGERSAAEFWDIIDGQTEDPLNDIAWLIKPWARYVFGLTGAVFTGIYPFQRVREYKLERTKISKSEKAADTGLAPTEVDSKSNNVLTVVEDYSDHYRLRQFQYAIHITGAETRDKIPLDILGVAEAEVKNPFRSAFGTDRWDRGLVNQITNKINEKTRTLGLDEALTAKSAAGARKIAQAVLKIVDDVQIIGIEITGFKTTEINPVLTPDQLATIRAEALATQEAKKTRIDGKARADNLRDLNEANAAGGEFAIATMQAEGLVRAAKAAGDGGGMVILMPSSAQTSDPALLALLAEQKKANKGK